MRTAGIRLVPTPMSLSDWTDVVIVAALVVPWILIVALIIIVIVHDGELKQLANRVRTLEVIQRATWKSERD